MNQYLLIGAVAALVVTGLLLLRSWRRKGWVQRYLDARLEEHTEAVDRMAAARHAGLWIALAAGMGLFAELMIIRIHSADFQIFAYFKNVSLLSCFLGLGVGYAVAGRYRLWTPLVLPLLAAEIGVLHLLRYTTFAHHLHNPVPEQLALGLSPTSTLPGVVISYLFLVVVFLFNAAAFVPLGQLAARLMAKKPKLAAYSWNLVGSLAGIGLLSLMSMLWTPPPVWIVAVTLGLVVLMWHSARAAVPTVVAALLLLGLLAMPLRPGQVEIYSPYQVLTLEYGHQPPPVLQVNNVYFQRILDLRRQARWQNRQLGRWSYHYALPYVFSRAPKDVLVVGAGTGNDVAAALRNNAARVDAVEIDPAILAMGRRLHPEGPYRSPRVTTHANDARAFIRNTKRRYDLIVYGLLDSHTLLSGQGGVRLDSYVYTVEAFREARARLKPGGLIALSFCVVRGALGRKIFLMLQEAFGHAPTVYFTGYDLGYYFFIGQQPLPATPPHLHGKLRPTPVFARLKVEVDKSTDDWPFLYMAQRSYPLSYLLMLVLLLAVSVVFVRQLMPAPAAGAPGAGPPAGAGFAARFSAPCFFLGAGFMLVETKGITELALAFGSTWMVTSVVIAAILTMAFLANLLVIRFGVMRPVVVYGLLLLSVVGGAFLASTQFAGGVGWGYRLGLTGLLTVPLFFSGFAFSSELKRAPSISVALSSNLLGSMLGGVLEYNSMYFGFRSLYALAVVMYLAAFLFSLRVDRK